MLCLEIVFNQIATGVTAVQRIQSEELWDNRGLAAYSCPWAF